MVHVNALINVLPTLAAVGLALTGVESVTVSHHYTLLSEMCVLERACHPVYRGMARRRLMVVC